MKMLSPHELDRRTNDGIRVRLLWCGHDGRVWVSVLDTKTDDSFGLEVRDDECPLDVFHHPYAYAAHHNIETRARIPRPATRRSQSRHEHPEEPQATSDRDRGDRALSPPDVDGQQPIGQPGDCNTMIDERLIPFHQHAEDHGTYVLAERAREADHVRPEDPPEGPSENTD